MLHGQRVSESAEPARGGAWDLPLEEAPLVLIDLETTGTDPESARVCELAALRTVGGRTLEALVSTVRPPVPVGASEAIHGLGDELLQDAPPLAALAPRLSTILRDAVVVGHRIGFDLAFLRAAAARGQIDEPPRFALDTHGLATRAWHRGGYSLDALCAERGLPRPTHRAEPDARACGALLDVLSAELRASTPRHLWQAQRRDRPIRLRDDVRGALERGLREGRTVRIAYRVPSRGPVVDELAVYALRPPRVEGRLLERGVLRVLRGDRLLWAEPAGRPYAIPPGFTPRCPPPEP